MSQSGIESTSQDVLILQNKHLQASFCPVTGKLTSLTSVTQPDENLIDAMDLRYFNAASHEQVTLDKALQISQPDKHHITTVYSNAQIRLTLNYTLDDHCPLLKIRSTIVSLAKDAADAISQISISRCLLPGLGLASDFNDMFEDPRDLYFDGAELGDGNHLPAWRVFFRNGYEKGLMLATRNKPAMGRFNFMVRAIECRLVNENNYATDLDCVHEQWQLAPGASATTEFEVGPWNAAHHETMLKQASLQQPVPFTQAQSTAAQTTAQGTAAKDKHNHTASPASDPLRMPIAQADNLDACSASDFQVDRWLRVTLPADPSKPEDGPRDILFANTGVAPQPVIFTPKLRGPHHVFVGIAHGNGMTLKQSNAAETIYREGAPNPAPFKIALRGGRPAMEISFGVLDLQGQSLHINRFPNTNGMAMVQYIRFEPAAAAVKETTATARPQMPLAGFADSPDISSILNADDPDPQIVDDVIKAHAQAEVRQCFWRIDGQCADFPSRHNTMRYISAKVHGVFSPQSKSYGRLLRKVDLLDRAVKAGKANDVSMWGWMRFNNYSGNVASDFFKQNPQLREEKEHGAPANQLCLAFEEVRAHKRRILIEAAGYGLDGLCLGFMRHPPILQYAKVLCEAYEKAYGTPPPRDRSNTSYDRGHSYPPYDDEAFVQWWQFRANYLTTFARELKADLAQAGMGHVKIAIWVRPNYCLHDGIDLDAWLEEGLCDQVISSPYIYAYGKERPWWYWETDAWMDKVRAKVPLYRDIPMNAKYAREDIAHALTRKFDGLCLYESNQVVMDSEYLELIEQIKTRG